MARDAKHVIKRVRACLPTSSLYIKIFIDQLCNMHTDWLLNSVVQSEVTNFTIHTQTDYFWVERNLCRLFLVYFCIVVRGPIIQRGMVGMSLIGLTLPYVYAWYKPEHWFGIRVITKLPSSKQSSKGKVKTHKCINRQNQSTTGKLWKP